MACTQGLDRPRLVVAFAHYSPWVMPGRSVSQCFMLRAHRGEFSRHGCLARH